MRDDKKYTLLAVSISNSLGLKPIEPRIVYMPESKMLNIATNLYESIIFHICHPSTFIKALSSASDTSPHIHLTLWKYYCCIIFPSKDNMFCHKCFTEFDSSLSKKIAVIRAAGTLNL